MRLGKNRGKKTVPAINSTSTADISFMLLIFFLLTTSMEQDKGLQRRLPHQDDDKQENVTDVDKNMVFTLAISADGIVTCNDSIVEEPALMDNMARFIEQKGPEHIIELRSSVDADYQTYFHLQNIIARVYGKLREEYANKKYHKPLMALDDEQTKKVYELYPQRLSENFDGQRSASVEESAGAVAFGTKGGRR